MSHSDTSTASPRHDLSDQELAAEIVTLLRARAKNDYVAYCALVQAAVDYQGVSGLALHGGSLIRLLQGGEL
ncbi:hypothetical protein [Halomonas sp.]|uniref:hypothetical protein n=1 Tax=Halomonas sp. TaxID=1486246 RepID=UPI00257F411F|nr:hypothetical protein [Halomonas sp.]MCJ8285134.1 hypothetical protein [Halomonas sp.]NQY70184.1 hypothetical protein [Halomonas sp.]